MEALYEKTVIKLSYFMVTTILSLAQHTFHKNQGGIKNQC